MWTQWNPIYLPQRGYLKCVEISVIWYESIINIFETFYSGTLIPATIGNRCIEMRTNSSMICFMPVWLVPLSFAKFPPENRSDYYLSCAQCNVAIKRVSPPPTSSPKPTNVSKMKCEVAGRYIFFGGTQSWFEQIKAVVGND